MVVVNGGVKSNLSRIHRVLPETSLYLDIAEDFERLVKHSQRGAIPSMVYAQGVVAEILRSKTKRTYWRGNHAWLVWFLRNVSNFLLGKVDTPDSSFASNLLTVRNL